FVGLSAGLFADATGAGPFGAIMFGPVTAALLLAVGQTIFALARSPLLRAVVALTFAIPAALTGYYATYNLFALTSSSDFWQQAFAFLGAFAVGITSWLRLAPPPSAGVRHHRLPEQP